MQPGVDAVRCYCRTACTVAVQGLAAISVQALHPAVLGVMLMHELSAGGQDLWKPAVSVLSQGWLCCRPIGAGLASATSNGAAHLHMEDAPAKITSAASAAEKVRSNRKFSRKQMSSVIMQVLKQLESRHHIKRFAFPTWARAQDFCSPGCTTLFYFELRSWQLLSCHPHMLCQ